MQTRAQKDLQMAYELVSRVQEQYPDAKNETKSIHSQLCKQFPIMVLQSGLCQTLAFHADKAKKDDARAKAHQIILQHIAQIMNVETALTSVQTCGVLKYIYFTRRILEAWVFFKRFAVSALKLEKEVT